MQEVDGSCLCGRVKYKFIGHIGIFQYCHCSRCRKFTGAAFAANLLVSPDHFEWLAGSDNVCNYIPEETKYLTTAFCQTCGSSMPWYSKIGKVVVIPAGTLNGVPDIKPIQNIFCGSQARWYIDPSELPQYMQLPLKKE